MKRILIQNCECWKTSDGTVTLIKYNSLTDGSPIAALMHSEYLDEVTASLDPSSTDDGFPYVADLGMAILSAFNVFNPVVLTDKQVKFSLSETDSISFYKIDGSTILLDTNLPLTEKAVDYFQSILEGYKLVVSNISNNEEEPEFNQSSADEEYQPQDEDKTSMLADMMADEPEAPVEPAEAVTEAPKKRGRKPKATTTQN